MTHRYKCFALDSGTSVASKLSVDFGHKNPTFIIHTLLKTTSCTNNLVL